MMLLKYITVSAVLAFLIYCSLCKVMHGKVFVPWEDAEGNVVPIKEWWDDWDISFEFNPTPPPPPPPPVFIN